MGASDILGRGVGRLLTRRASGGGLVRHDLEPPPGFAATYRHPGQYVDLIINGQNTFFALSGEVGAQTWEVFVRAGGDVADALMQLPGGSELGLSSALGTGFPLAAASNRRLFVLATGSGIAAVRPVLNQRVRDGQAAITELLVGVQRHSDVPLSDELAEWAAHGVVVTLCLSREATASLGSAAVHGYVQTVLVDRAEKDPPALTGAMIFAAGVPAMVSDVRRLATRLGLPEADVRTNY